MRRASNKKAIWGWMMYDWASQPFHTLIITFVFAPFVAEMMTTQLMGQGASLDAAKAGAQSYWGFVVAAAGLCVALSAPIVGALADSRKLRMRLIYLFSIAYVIGSFGLWFASPHSFSPIGVAAFFILAVIGLEITTVLTNALLPYLGSRDEIGRISGDGWSWGYVGGFLSLVIMLLFFVDNSQGRTFLGGVPALGFDGGLREGTRFVGPFSALWFLVFMIPFVLWVRDAKEDKADTQSSIFASLKATIETVKALPEKRSQFAFLGASMFYRDGLNGLYAFGGIYAYSALGWSAQDMGIFGIIGIISGVVFTYLGGVMDAKLGPKPVITFSVYVMIVVCIAMLLISRGSVFLVSVPPESVLPDIAFYVCGAVLGAAGGAVQTASRTMMVRQSDPARMSEAFGLYALSGKATAFMAPLLVGVVTALTSSTAWGISPIILLLIVGLVLLFWVHPKGEQSYA